MMGPLTFSVLREHVDQTSLFTEEETGETVQLLGERMKIVVEPAGAVR